MSGSGKVITSVVAIAAVSGPEMRETLSICYTIAARGLRVVNEWPVLIGHEGEARVVYQN